MAKKKFFLIILLFLVFSLFTLIPFSTEKHFSLFTSSAETTLERAQKDYTFQYTKYRDAQEKYLVAKSTFETFKTAVAKGEAFVKTKEYLAQIDSVYVAYLLLVKEHGNYVDWGQEEPQKAEIFKIIDSEITYFQDHPKQIEATQTLEELPALAKSIKEYTQTNLPKKIFKALAAYELVETLSAYDKFVELADKLDVLVSARLEQEPNPFLANWSSEIKDIKEKAAKPLEEAKTELAKTAKEGASEGNLDQISQLCQKSKEELKKSQALFEEAIRIL